MRQSHTIVQTYFPKLCISFSLIHIFGGDIMMAKLKMLLSFILYAIFNHPKECMQTLTPQMIGRHHMTHGKTLIIPKEAFFIFYFYFFNTGSLVQVPFATIRKCLCDVAPPFSKEHNPTMHFSLRNFLDFIITLKSTSVPPIVIATKGSELLRQTQVLSCPRERTRACIIRGIVRY